MSIDFEKKYRTRFKKLHETLEKVEQQEEIRSAKASICDKMLEIYKNKDLDMGQKSELFIQVLSSVQDGLKK